MGFAQEIWDALKAAAEALETGNRDLAQAILDGASITLPSGVIFCTSFFVTTQCSLSYNTADSSPL